MRNGEEIQVYVNEILLVIVSLTLYFHAGDYPTMTWGIDQIVGCSLYLLIYMVNNFGQLRDQGWEFRGRIKQLMKGKINQLYKIVLSPTSQKLKSAKSEKAREQIMKNYTKQRVGELLDDGAFLQMPVGPEEVRMFLLLRGGHN